MRIIAYYEGDPNIEHWLQALFPAPTYQFEFRKLPASNNSKNFVRLPGYVGDILYLDKPDLILSGCIDGVHERPLLSLDFAACTPQYQHALQRFSRMMAAVSNGCPSAIVFPLRKKEGSGGSTMYQRSQALEFGAVRLMDVFRTPAVVFDWPDTDGILDSDPTYHGYPPLNSPEVAQLKDFVKEAIAQFTNVDYIGALNRSPEVVKATHRMRARAYVGNHPTIAKPGGGAGVGGQQKLDLKPTSTMIGEIASRSVKHRKMVKDIPSFITSREKSLVFYPTRIVKHAGDPYVGMLSYYDISFCRTGAHTRDRQYNLVADCENVPIAEVYDSLRSYNNETCPFTKPISDVGFYSYHFKNGCSQTKSKPLRIYGELVDVIVFKDGCLYSVG